MEWTPHKYQLNAVKFIIERACAGLFLEPGLGKTVIVLQAFNLLRQRKMVKKMLVIAPLRVAYSTWPAEAEKWDELSDLKVGVLHGPDKLKVLKDPTVDVHVINPEGLPWLLSTVKSPGRVWEMLTVDESTRFKAHDTMRFKLIRGVLSDFYRRVILTGSPAPNGLLDLWGQIFILDQGHALGQYISHYRTNYFIPDFSGYGWKLQKGADKKIYSKLEPLVIRMAAKDYLELPPLIGACGQGSEPAKREVDLPEEAMEQYTAMEDDFITKLRDEKFMAPNAAAAMNKCQQIANGWIYNEKHEGQLIHEAKLDAVEELLEELSGTPVFLGYEFVHDKDRLLKRFGAKTPWIGGGDSKSKFREIERNWNAGKIPLLIAQFQSVSHGLNLQGTKAAGVALSTPWDLEVYEQWIRRIYRQGQTDPVFIYHIAARKTIDEVKLKRMMSKDKAQQNFLSALRSEYL